MTAETIACECAVNPITWEWERIEQCPIHGVYTHTGELAWWRWADYDGYPPDTDDPIAVTNDEIGRTTILPPDTVVEWREASGVVKAGSFVGKAGNGRVDAVGPNRPELAIGVALQDSTEDGQVLVAIGVGIYPVRYVIPPGTPPKPDRTIQTPQGPIPYFQRRSIQPWIQ